MKKEEAVEAVERAGHTINDLNARAWATAFNPTEYGWGSSLLSIVAIPVMNAATIGHLVTSVVVKQVSPNVFDSLSNLGGKKEP